MRPTVSVSAPSHCLPPGVVERLRTVDPLDPAFFSDVVDDTMSAAEERVRLILGEDAAGSASAAVWAFLVDVLLHSPAEEIVRRGGSPSAFARIVRELEHFPHEQGVGRALEAIGRLPEELEQ